MSELEPSTWDRLQAFWDSGEGRDIRGLDDAIRSRELVRQVMVIILEYVNLSRMARQLLQLDRELRRTLRILDPVRASGVTGIFIAGMTRDDIETMYRQKSRRGSSQLPSPAPLTYGGLRVTDASIGSAHFVVEAYSFLEELLTSRPLIAFTTLLTIMQSYGSIRVWMNLRSDPLAKISSRNALRILREFGNRPERAAEDAQPELDVPFYGGEAQSPGPPSSVLTLPDGTRVASRRITHIRINADGTQDIIQAEG